jgi:ribonuclease HI
MTGTLPPQLSPQWESRPDGITLHTLCWGFVKATSNPLDLKSTALALRLAKQMGPEVYAEVLNAALVRRQEWRTWQVRAQRKWQTNTSRRPARGRHHDSWSIREKYVRY